MDLTLTFLNHILPVVITLALALVLVSLYVGMPYCKYVYAVSRADTREGKEDLARYLATQTGGRKIDVTSLWPSFMPAARRIHEDHLSRLRSRDGWGGLKLRESWGGTRRDGGSAF